MKIGFIGLGNMGKFMSMNLDKAGHQVYGFDLNSKVFKDLKNFNIIETKSLEEISLCAEIIITMLPDGKAVDTVYNSLIKNLKPNTLIVDCSTIDVKTTKKLHQNCNDRKILILDAPVSGGTIGAQNGTLTFMVGGQQEAFKKMEPLFNIMGKKAILCGAGGTGQAVKVCNNLILAITMAGIGEALQIANANNLETQKLFEVVSTSTGSCWAINNYFPVKGVGPQSPADNNFEPGFSSSLMYKDLSLASEIANPNNLNLDLGQKVIQKYLKMIQDMKGNLDFSAIVNEIN